MNLSSIPFIDVWAALGGAPLRGKRAKAFWRGGDGYSVALDLAKGTWFDHRDGRGGGVLALVETTLGCDRRSALQWLEANCELDSRRPLSAAEWQLLAERWGGANAVADDIVNWRDAVIAELNASKVAAVHVGDDIALTRAASLCNVLENGSPADVVREFIRDQGRDPANVERLIAAGREQDFEAQRVTVGAVILLSHARAAENSRNAA